MLLSPWNFGVVFSAASNFGACQELAEEQVQEGDVLIKKFVLTKFRHQDVILTTDIPCDAQELRDAFLAIDTGDGQLDAFELEEAARKVAPWRPYWNSRVLLNVAILGINVGIRKY